MSAAKTQRFSGRLTECLKERHVSRAKLARSLGVSQNTVSSWTTGLHSPKAVVLPQIAQELDTSVGDLFGEKRPQRIDLASRSDEADLEALELVHRLAALQIGESVERLADAAGDLLEILRQAERLAAK